MISFPLSILFLGGGRRSAVRRWERETVWNIHVAGLIRQAELAMAAFIVMVSDRLRDLNLCWIESAK